MCFRLVLEHLYQLLQLQLPDFNLLVGHWCFQPKVKQANYNQHDRQKDKKSWKQTKCIWCAASSRDPIDINTKKAGYDRKNNPAASKNGQIMSYFKASILNESSQIKWETFKPEWKEGNTIPWQ